MAMKMEHIPVYAVLRRVCGFIGRCLPGLGSIALVTIGALALHFSLSTTGNLYLLIVVPVALLFGFGEATVASLGAAACLNYFFVEPVFSFYVANGQDWIALAAFECCALIVSRLSFREKRHAREAVLQRTSMEKLYELSRNTLLIDLRQPPGCEVVRLMQQAFSLESIALFDAKVGEVEVAGAWVPADKDLARSAFLRDSNYDDPLARTFQRVLRLDGTSIGSLILRGECSPIIANSLASLGAIAFERYCSFESETRTEAAHQSEKLRAAVLDSLAHAFKTPLTTIRTASSGLLAAAGLAPAQADLVALIDDESAELNDLCTRLLQTAKLEAQSLGIEKSDVLISQLVEEVVADYSVKHRRHLVQISIPDDKLAVLGDRKLLAMILAEYVSNAGKYSFPGTAIEISAQESCSEVVIAVHNYGSTIPLRDRDRIFERFYRLPDSKKIADGTGIGLSIVKKAAEAHHGHVWVISGEAEGTTFFVSLPLTTRRAI